MIGTMHRPPLPYQIDPSASHNPMRPEFNANWQSVTGQLQAAHGWPVQSALVQPSPRAHLPSHESDPAIRSGLLRNRKMSTPRKRSEEHTSELQSRPHLVCRLLLEK